MSCAITILVSLRHYFVAWIIILVKGLVIKCCFLSFLFIVFVNMSLVILIPHETQWGHSLTTALLSFYDYFILLWLLLIFLSIIVLFLDLVMDNDNPDCTVGAPQSESAQGLAVFSHYLFFYCSEIIISFCWTNWCLKNVSILKTSESCGSTEQGCFLSKVNWRKLWRLVIWPISFAC